MSRRGPLVLDLVLPGGGLILADHLVAGIPLLLTALAAGTALVLGQSLATPTFWARLWPIAAGAWGTALVLAVMLQLWWGRAAPRQHPEAIKIHRAFVRAWLGGDAAEARTQARRLVLLIPGHPGAWELLRLAAINAGGTRDERRARRQLRRLAARNAD